MRLETIPRHFLPTRLLSGWTLLCVLALMTVPTAAQTKKTTNRSAEIASYTKQLSTRFANWDLNGDKTLDSTELALAFRGPNAKPYDFAPDNTPAALKANVNKTYLKMLSRLTPYLAKEATPINHLLADVLFRSWSFKKTLNPADYANYPDYQFLLLAGTTGLPKLSKQEYDSWGTQYANMIADVQDSNRSLKAAQSKLQKAKKMADKQKAQAEVSQCLQNVSAAATTLSAVPAAVQQKLAVRPESGWPTGAPIRA